MKKQIILNHFFYNTQFVFLCFELDFSLENECTNLSIYFNKRIDISIKFIIIVFLLKQ